MAALCGLAAGDLHCEDERVDVGSTPRVEHKVVKAGHGDNEQYACNRECAEQLEQCETGGAVHRRFPRKRSFDASAAPASGSIAETREFVDNGGQAPPLR